MSSPLPKRGSSAARASLLALALLAVAACGDAPPVAPAAPAADGADALARRTSVEEPASGPWARIVRGEIGPGSLYAVYVPRDWNGEAVFYAHGFRDVATPVDLREDQDGLGVVRDQLGALGYAVAYSSYSRNGFAVKDGAQRTHQLRGLLARELRGQPERSYLAGHSLGAGIALHLVERFPRQYDGALLVCGMVGGSLLQTQYLGHVRALADLHFPGALPGSVTGVPEGTVVTLPQVIGMVQSNPVGLFTIASTAQTPLPYVPVGDLLDPGSPASQTLVGSLYAALSFHARGINDIRALTPGDLPFDNADTQYAVGTVVAPAPLAPLIPTLVAAQNAGVARYEADRPATNYLERHFTPTGDLEVPVLTVHNVWDPAVPAFHEAALLAAAQAAGAEANLLQRYVPTYGHCAIDPAYVVQSLTDLAAWARTGTKPAM